MCILEISIKCGTKELNIERRLIIYSFIKQEMDKFHFKKRM